MLSLAKPDHLYQVLEYYHFPDLDWILIGLFYASEFPGAGNRSGVRWWHDVYSKRRSAFPLFQKETGFGYDFRISWLITWCRGPSNHAQLSTFFPSWVCWHGSNQRRLVNFHAFNGLLGNASKATPSNQTTSHCDFNTKILQGLAICRSVYRVKLHSNCHFWDLP